LDGGGMHVDGEQQAEAIYQNVSFSSQHLLPRIKTTLSGLASSFNALAIEGRCRGCFFFRLSRARDRAVPR
jgi:hypothetical protein